MYDFYYITMFDPSPGFSFRKLGTYLCRLLGGLAILFGFVFVLTLPSLCPIRGAAINLIMTSGVKSLLPKAVDTLNCVYKGMFVFTGELTPKPNSTNIYVSLYAEIPEDERVRFSPDKAGMSFQTKSGGFRTVLCPTDSNFSGRTLAHEIGHYRFGNVCCSDILGVSAVLNSFFDFWIDASVTSRLLRFRC
jgi:hypothetical protein